MKRFTRFIGMVVLCGAGLVACSEHIEYHPLSPEYGMGNVGYGGDSRPDVRFYHRDANKKLTLLWPYVGSFGEPMLFTNGMAVFVGDMPDKQGRRGTGDYLAARGNGPILSISDDLLKLWSASNHLDFHEVRETYRPVQLRAVGNLLQFGFNGLSFSPKCTVTVTWEQIAKIIQEVQEKGETNTLRHSKVVYKKMNYGPTPNHYYR